MTLLLISAFILGVTSTMHCVAMCGGIAGALTASLDMRIRLKNKDLFSYMLAYNCGRIVSYTAAGAVAGSLGFEVVHLTAYHIDHNFLQLLSSLFLFIIAFHLVGLFPKLSALQRLGQPFWRHLEPYGQRVLPVRTLTQAFIFGMVWGCLPCVIVYSALVWTLMAGGFWQGMAIMLAFGLGTLPFVLTTGFFATSVIRWARTQAIRRGAGVLLMVFAAIGLFLEYVHYSKPHLH